MTPRETLLVLKKRFWLILAGAVVAGLAALVLSLVWPVRYKAEALLLITKLRPSVTLDPRFETLAEENVVNMTIQEDQVRRQTLVALADSADLKAQVLAALGGILPAEERSKAYLGRAVEVGTDGNLIVVEARAGTPDKAASIANAWADAFKESVNRLYSTTSPSDAEIQAQVASAETSYEAAKRAVEEFLLQSQEGELLRQIEQKRQVLADMQTTYVESARLQQEALLTHVGHLGRLLLQAQSLKAKLAGAPASTPLTSGEQFSLFVLEAAGYAQGESLPTALEIGQGWSLDGDLTAGQTIGRLDRLERVLKAAQDTARGEAQALSLSLLKGGDLLASGSDGAASAGIADLQGEINALESELERERMQKEDLVGSRDVAQENYLTLLRKAAEVQIVSQLTGVEVELAARAQPPEVPSLPSRWLMTVLGLLAGGLAGLAFAFALEMWPKV